jgi:DNA-binding transcriptional LysR family regulator
LVQQVPFVNVLKKSLSLLGTQGLRQVIEHARIPKPHHRRAAVGQLSNPIVVIAPTSDPLAKRIAVPLHELAKRRFILRKKGSGTRMTGDQFFSKHKFRPDIRLEMGSNEALKESVAGELGLGLVSSHALHGLAKEYGVCVIDVEGFPLSSAWHIVHPAGKHLSPLAEAFKQHLSRASVAATPSAPKKPDPLQT